MTGSEIAAAAANVAKSAVQTGHNILGQDEATNSDIRELAKESSAMRVAAELRARRVAVKEDIVLKLYKPLAWVFRVRQEYFDSDFSRDMAEKLAPIPDENLVTPKATVAFPAMQGLGFSLDEENLKEMYLNLLATASDDRRSPNAHPAFAEIIRQLSGEEAQHLLAILGANKLPMVRLKIDQPSGGYVTLNQYFVNIPGCDPALRRRVSEYSDNWERLGLIERTYVERILGDQHYEWIEATPEVQELRSQGISVSWDPGILRATSFGSRFLVAVSPIQLPPGESREI